MPLSSRRSPRAPEADVQPAGKQARALKRVVGGGAEGCPEGLLGGGGISAWTQRGEPAVPPRPAGARSRVAGTARVTRLRSNKSFWLEHRPVRTKGRRWPGVHYGSDRGAWRVTGSCPAGCVMPPGVFSCGSASPPFSPLAYGRS